MVNKLEYNYADTTERRRIIYVVSRIGGTAFGHIKWRSNLNKCPNPYLSATEIFHHLRSIYSDPNKKKTAMRAFSVLQMKESQPFTEFYAEFQRLLTYQKTTEDSQLISLEFKITEELRSA